MEQGSQKEKIGGQIYRIYWHPEIKENFDIISESTVEAIIKETEYRLSRAPLHIGKPLKGTNQKLWRLRFAKYRIIYTVNTETKEVWVLGIKSRATVYSHPHVLGMLKLAVSLQEEINQMENFETEEEQ